MKRTSIFLFLICLCTNLLAQSVQIMAHLDSTEILVGDQIYLHIEAECPAGTQVDFPFFTDTISKEIEVLDTLPRRVNSKTDGSFRIVQSYLITSFDSGYHTLPPIPIFIKSDNLSDTIYTRPLNLFVSTLSIENDEKIADIKDIYDLPLNFDDILPYLLYGLIALLVIAVIIFGIYYYRRKKANKPLFKAAEPPIPPHIKALQDLDSLQAEKLWQSGLNKEYHTRISDILRTYIDGRFDINAMELTREEILRALKKQKFTDKDLTEKLNAILLLSDLVKFAKVAPLSEENEGIIKDSYLFVNQTKIEGAKND